jgi:hypothetical protein
MLVGVAVLVLFACSAPTPPSLDELAADQPLAPPQKSTTPPVSTTTNADASVPDAPTTCQTVAPNNRCGIDPQCGCASNETCDVTNETSGATSCVTAGGATLGRPCTQTGDCLAGFTCEYGACRPYCKTPRTKCGVGGTDLCVEILGADSKPIANKSVCTINCDPRVPAAVCGTNACQWFATYYAPNNKVSDCNFGGTAAALAVCVDTGDCQPGLACIKHPKFGLECEKWCRIGQVPSDCDPKFTCKDVFGADAPVINGVKEGVCQD